MATITFYREGATVVTTTKQNDADEASTGRVTFKSINSAKRESRRLRDLGAKWKRPQT
jgi:hypothetical protein